MPAVLYIIHIVFHPIYARCLSIVIALARRVFDVHLWVYYVLWEGKSQILMFLASKVVYEAIWKNCKRSAPGEDRTHGLQIARVCVIMRLTRYLLRYRGTWSARAKSIYQDLLLTGLLQPTELCRAPWGPCRSCVWRDFVWPTFSTIFSHWFCVKLCTEQQKPPWPNG